MRTKLWLVALLGSAAIFAAAALRDPAPAPSGAARTAPTATSAAAPSVTLPDFVSTSTPPAAGADSAPAATPAPSPAAPAALAAADENEDRHPGAKVDEATILRLHGDRPLTATHPTIAAAIAVQEKNSDWLMAHPAVVGTAIGLNDEGAVALIVYTKVDAPELPKSIEGLPVAPFLSGVLVRRLQQAAPSKGPPSAGSGSTVDPTKRFARPVPIGVSTGHPDITAGTIGCRVRGGGNVYALSNNHVYANENLAGIGDNVLQPGPFDGGLEATDVIGKLAKFETIVFTLEANNVVDAALALSSEAELGRGTPPTASYGLPRSNPASAVLRQKVQKFGRTTGHTEGTVGGLNAKINIGYDQGTARFINQIIITPGSFSAGGDSGSLIVLKHKTPAENRRPVGLLFAGGPSMTIANPIQPVLAAMGNVVIDGE